jgi:arsenate reductase
LIERRRPVIDDELSRDHKRGSHVPTRANLSTVLNAQPSAAIVRALKLPARKWGNMAKTVTIYGIKNCDTIKKARAWLDDRGVAYGFHDYKSAGVDRGTLDRWARATGWETLLNRAGTTFRKLPDKDKEGLTEKKAIALMLAQPSMIKRPVLDIGGKLLVGFKAEDYAKAFGR